MTTLNTIEELEALPDGSIVQVATPAHVHPSTPRVWTWQDGNMHLDGVQLPPAHFYAAINDGLITVGSTIEVGQVYRSGSQDTSWYILAAGEDTGRWKVLITHMGNFHNLNEALSVLPESAQLVDLNDRTPGWVRTDRLAFSMGLQLLAGRQRGDDTDNVTRLNRRIETINDALIELHGELCDTDDQRMLRDLLDAHELRGVSRDVDLRITVSGYTYLNGDYMSAGDLRQLADVDGLDSISGEGSITVNWTHEFNMTETYEGDDSDPCEDEDFVNTDLVEGWLSDMGISYEEFTIDSRHCDHC